jgi:NAD-dependent SIR2 family protein deacetylase
MATKKTKPDSIYENNCYCFDCNYFFNEFAAEEIEGQYCCPKCKEPIEYADDAHRCLNADCGWYGNGYDAETLKNGEKECPECKGKIAEGFPNN